MREASKRSSDLTPAERKILADLAPRPACILPIEALAIGGPRRLAKELTEVERITRPITGPVFRWDDGTWDQEC